VDFGERITGWYVLVELIDSGQEIHVGEEAGLGQWRTALEKAGDPSGWTVHAAGTRLSLCPWSEGSATIDPGPWTRHPRPDLVERRSLVSDELPAPIEGRALIYATADGTVRVDARTISEHLTNIYSSGELQEHATLRRIRRVRREGAREVVRAISYCNLIVPKLRAQ